jgi:hypothetical protein
MKAKIKSKQNYRDRAAVGAILNGVMAITDKIGSAFAAKEQRERVELIAEQEANKKVAIQRVGNQMAISNNQQYIRDMKAARTLRTGGMLYNERGTLIGTARTVSEALSSNRSNRYKVGGRLPKDPDHDGDDDRSAHTDYDHDVWSANGKRIKASRPGRYGNRFK